MATSIQQSEFLTSWKEIAEYLGKGVRTVQRWEELFGLPVRRPDNKNKGFVCAARDDLDAWMKNRWTPRPKAEPISFDLASVHARIARTSELRAANRQLQSDVARSLNAVIAECRLLISRVGAPGNRPSVGK